jgi:hypothetical protein
MTDETIRVRTRLWRQNWRLEIRTRLSGIVTALARALGSPIVDCRTGRPIGRALVFAWRGKVHIVGLRAWVMPCFLPQKRMTFWRQALGFTLHEEVDFPRERPAERGGAAPDSRPR